MATFFGEVLPIESRAFWDDLDDCDVEGFGVEVEILDKDSLDSSYNILIVTDGVLASKFAQKLLVDRSTKKIALFYETFSTGCRKSPSLLYKLADGTLLLTTYDKLDIRLANILLLKLFPWLQKCLDVVVFTSLHISKFQNKDSIDLSTPLLRCLATSSFKGNRSAPQLEVTNYVCGFSASIVSLCQVLKKSAVLYICYTDCYSLDSINISPFIQLLNSFGIKPLPKYQDAALNTITDEFSLSSNLYI